MMAGIDPEMRGCEADSSSKIAVRRRCKQAMKNMKSNVGGGNRGMTESA